MKRFIILTGICLCLQVLARGQSDSDSAKYYFDKSQNTKALPFAQQSFEAVKHLNSEDTAYIEAAYTLAVVYGALARNDSAMVYHVKACDGAKKQYGASSQKYGRYLVDLATTCKEAGKLPEAEQQYQKAIAILKEINVPYKNDYAFSLIQLGNLYTLMGNLNKAEELFIAASNVAPREPLEKKTEYALALHELGILYERMGNYRKQETIQVQVLGMLKEMYGEQHSAYASALNNLAILYNRNHNLEMADSMFRKALEIKKQANGENSAAYIMVLNNLGVINTEMEKYETAEKYLKENVEIAYKNGGEETLQYPFCLRSLARLYAISNRIELAEPIFEKALVIYNKLGVDRNATRLKLLYDMSRYLYADNVPKKAIYLKEAVETENKLLLEKLNFLSEAELLVYLKGIEVYSARPYIFLMQHKSPEIAVAAYNTRLSANSISLQNTRYLYQNMSQSKDGELNRLWKNYLQHKSFYTNLLLTPIAKRSANTDSIAAALNQEEKDILRRSADYRKVKEILSVQWQDVQKHLRNNEASIEFVRFKYRFDTYSTIQPDTVYYAALLLRPQDTVPQFVMLCEEKQLIAAMKKFPYKAATKSRGAKPAYNQNNANDLYKLIWQPLEPYLTHSRTVYFSPDGLLHHTAFSAIPYKKEGLLCDKYDLVQLTSTRQIVLQQSRPSTPVSIAMFGGIHYDQQAANESIAASPASNNYINYQGRGADLDSFRFLPHTLTEINMIKMSAKASQKEVTIFTGDHATEAAFRSLGGNNSPAVIHFATHGFTFPDTPTQESDPETSFKASDNPLLRCGLVMAGGNRGWQGKAHPNEDDGILTGLEISSVQLPNTQLAVLSACETGLGKIEGSEGVFGLQRAFKLAGVNYIMASLWQVPDKETAEFMQNFYAQWLGGKTIRQAFLNTQQTMRKKYTPYYWAGFTLVQ
ncbi:CHAT domain-containing protein [Niabella aquatica]